MNPIIDSAHRLRGGLRLVVFFLASFVALYLVLGPVLLVLHRFLPPAQVDRFTSGTVGFLLQGLAIFLAAYLIGWACAALFEKLTAASLGWALHRSWWRDLILGIVVGGLTLTLAGAIAGVKGGYKFELTFDWAATGRTLLTSGLVFMLAAAAEEALFRGYGLQTMVRAGLPWLGVAITSILFALVHLANPNVSLQFTFLNTFIAGVWLSVGYLKTRSLWFALGLHFSWNWVMGAVFGISVSGIDQLTPVPLMHVRYSGPAWLNGGEYGLEGGIACTVAIVISTVVVWRLGFLRPSVEMIEASEPVSASGPTDEVAISAG